MFFVWALALAGLFLIYLEFFLPGAIMAIGGSVLLLSSIVMFYLVKADLLLLMLYLLALAAAVYVVIRIAHWRIRSVEKKRQSIFALPSKEVVGKTAKTSTDLTPSGHVCIDDTVYQALSESGPIVKGTNVVVLKEQGTHLIVQAETPREPSQ